MRNPWANERYTGKWNVYDSNWNNETLRQVGGPDSDESIFYVNFPTFKKYFGSFAIAMYETSWVAS